MLLRAQEPEKILQQLKSGNIRTLGQTITLFESELEADRILAKILLDLIGKEIKSKKIVTPILGISGTPGVGKSSFIERIGIDLCSRFGKKLAVLAIDPSSPVHGGSILGDKTRMEELSRLENAFIRPTPGRIHTGGIGQYVLEVLLLFSFCEYDFIIVESIGVGQSEFDLNFLVDKLLVLMQPASGDDLQALKKGLLELADYVILNKADGPQLKLAEKSLSQLKVINQLGIPKHHWRQNQPYIQYVSAKTGLNVDDFLNKILKDFSAVNLQELLKIRSEKLKYYFELKLKDEIIKKIKDTETYKQQVSSANAAVEMNYANFFNALETAKSQILKKI